MNNIIKFGEFKCLLLRPSSESLEIDLYLLNGKTKDLKLYLIQNHSVKIWGNKRYSSHMKFKILDEQHNYEYDVVDELRFGKNGSGKIILKREIFGMKDIIIISKIFHLLFDKSIL